MDESESLHQELEPLYKTDVENEQFQIPQKPYPSWLRTTRSVFDAFLLSIILILASLLLIQSSHHQKSSLLKTPVPQFSQHIEVWMNDSSFSDRRMFTDQDLLSQILNNWLVKLDPVGRGWVKISNPEDFNLATPYTYTPDNPKYMITAFHQIHCLSLILRSFSAARLGNTTFVYDDHHLSHCFDYLRQGIICAADSTLEGNNSTPDTGDITPWGSVHVCNDFDAVRAWGNQNRAPVNPGPNYP